MRKIYTGVDIGSDSIKIVVGEIFNEKMNVLTSTSVRSAGIRHGIIIDEDLVIDSLKLALEEIETDIGVKIDKAITTVPANDRCFSVVSGTTPIDINGEEVVNEDHISSVLHEAVVDKIDYGEELVSIIPITFSVDDIDNIIDPRGRSGKYLGVKAVLSTVPKENIYKVINVLNSCNIEVVDIVFGSIGDYFEAKNKSYDKELGAVINIGSETVNVSIFNKGILIKNSIIDLGSKNIDKDISYVYHLDLNSARNLKENFAVGSRRYADINDITEITTKDNKKITINQYELSEVVEARLVELLKLAKKEINHLTKRKISYIIVTGGITELAGFNYVIENTLGISAVNMNITTMGIRDNKFSTAAGLIKYLNDKLEIRDKNYSMFNSYQIESMMNNKNSVLKTNNTSLVGKVFGYFTSNKEG